jgi:hypothetical protein
VLLGTVLNFCLEPKFCMQPNYDPLCMISQFVLNLSVHLTFHVCAKSILTKNTKALAKIKITLISSLPPCKENVSLIFQNCLIPF